VRKSKIKEKVANLPWNKKNPKKRSKKLTAAEKKKAKKAAKKGKRKYPNLVDNMNAAKKKRKAVSDEDYFEI